jgi:hypothetical protein
VGIKRKKIVREGNDMKPKMLVSFSGGRTSAYMCKWLLENWSHLYEFVFVYANTSQEHLKTLEFVDKCDKYFGLNLIWIEATFGSTRKDVYYQIVDYKSCKKNGEVFENMIKLYGIPCSPYPHCTRELKLQPIDRFMRKNEIYKRSVGIRCDESDRIAKNFEDKNIYYPLIFNKPVTKDEVKLWWSKMPFDLEITEEYGNCTWCWKKSERKLLTLAKNSPEVFDFPNRMEEKYKDYIPSERFLRGNPQSNGDIYFFRNNTNAKQILNKSKQGNFKPFKENVGFQQTLFGEPLDLEMACNECGTVF